MKKKRFIKLLMGRVGASRNEAREEAAIVQCYQAHSETINRSAKRAGAKFRKPMYSYDTRWALYLVAMEYLREKQEDAKNEG